MQTPSFSLKDHLFNAKKVETLSFEISNAYPEFQRESFVATIMSTLTNLELKERISWISSCLTTHLPSEFTTACSIILNALPAPCDPTKTDDDFGDFIYAPYSHFIESHGCKEAYIDISLSALEEITTRFSVEFSIRQFITQFPEETYCYLKKWVSHPHYHVRRLVSEGTRPSLPWAKKINYEASRYLPLLNKLANDPTRFVTRSVANHLNDVSKIDPERVISLLKEWKGTTLQPSKEMSFIEKHSLRTLVKQGHPSALELLGFSSTPSIKSSLTLAKTNICIGDTIEFIITLTATTTANVMLDYIMSFQTKKKTPSSTVFKLKTLTLKKGESVSFSKRYTFNPSMSTRTFYPGTHTIQLQVNGHKQAQATFMLHDSASK